MGVLPIPSLPAIPAPTGASAVQKSPAAASNSSGFMASLAKALDGLQNTQNAANAQELSAASGQGSLPNMMIAAEKASLSTQLTMTVANKAVSAFNAVMNMQI
ncbi:MAG: flagellar hook-basal body complex protein FliE [Actinomycetota bacterium]|nr:flagellar hook-basal body complex protein FliE [Actinomycetota bacterium]